jgi:hypothetical protein
MLLQRDRSAPGASLRVQQTRKQAESAGETHRRRQLLPLRRGTPPRACQFSSECPRQPRLAAETMARTRAQAGAGRVPTRRAAPLR